jgi:hypothetical protein
MTLACTFHGIIGVQDAYAIDKKKMDGYVPLPLETEESAGDLHVTVFTFGGGSPPPEDGIYFINARILTVTNDDETNVEMCCVDVCPPFLLHVYRGLIVVLIVDLGHATTRCGGACTTFCSTPLSAASTTQNTRAL